MQLLGTSSLWSARFPELSHKVQAQPALLPFVERNPRSSLSISPAGLIQGQALWQMAPPLTLFWLHLFLSTPLLLPWCPNPLQNITVYCWIRVLVCSSLILAENCAQCHLDPAKLPITGEDTLQPAVSYHGFSLSSCPPSKWLRSNQKNKKATKIKQRYLNLCVLLLFER